MKEKGEMLLHYRFNENSLIIIPFTLKGYRLEGDEKVKFSCVFMNDKGEFPYVIDLEEDNKGIEGKDGYYTVTIDSAAKSILPGRYGYTIELVLDSGTVITLLSEDEAVIDIVVPKKGE